MPEPAGFIHGVFRTLMLLPVLFVTLIFTGCNKADESEPDPVEYPPSGNMYVSPASGFAPLSVNLSLNGIQKSNLLDSLYLFSDGVKVASKKASSFDTTMVFPAGTHSLYAKFVDVKGLSYLTPVTSVVASQNPAKAELSVSTNVSQSPLSLGLKFTGTPGPIPFKRYNLFITRMDSYFPDYWLGDKTASSIRAIDTTMTLYGGRYIMHGEIVDVNNNIVRTSDVVVNVWQDNEWRRDNPLPRGPVDLFFTSGSTPTELVYNTFVNQDARNVTIHDKMLNDISSKINGVGWNCNKLTLLFVFNSKNFDKNLYYNNKIVYDGYDGEDIAEILIHDGTRSRFGTMGIPAGIIEIPEFSHQMNYVVTGDDLLNPLSYNFTDAQPEVKMTNMQPGQAYFPFNCTKPMIGYYTYTYESGGKTYYAGIPVFTGMNVNGKFQVLKINPNVEIFMTRAEAKNYRK